MPLKNMSVTRHIVHTRNLFNFQVMTLSFCFVFPSRRFLSNHRPETCESSALWRLYSEYGSSRSCR
jgi:hypothetical protein